MKQLKIKPTETMTTKANVTVASHLYRRTRVIQVLFPFLRHVNAATLSVVMMVSLALFDAMRNTHPSATKTAVDNVMIAGKPTDVSIGRPNTLNSSGSHRLDQRTRQHPCSAFARSSACLL